MLKARMFVTPDIPNLIREQSGRAQYKGILVVMMMPKNPAIRLGILDQALQLYGKCVIELVRLVLLRIMKEGRDIMRSNNSPACKWTLQFMTDERAGVLMQDIEIIYG